MKPSPNTGSAGVHAIHNELRMEEGICHGLSSYHQSELRSTMNKLEAVTRGENVDSSKSKAIPER